MTFYKLTHLHVILPPKNQHQGRPEKLIGHHSIIDDEIDSLTCMLDDLDSYSQNSTQVGYLTDDMGLRGMHREYIY